MRTVVTFPAMHRRGGVERVALECANYLAGRGHPTNALAGEFDHASIDPAVMTHQLKFARSPAFLTLPRFLAASEATMQTIASEVDVVSGFGAATPPGGVAWLTSVHAAWLDISRKSRPLTGRLKQRANPFHPVILRLEKNLLKGRQYRKLIALTEGVKADAMRFYGVPAEDIVVVPNGYSASEFYPDRGARRELMRARLGYVDSDVVVIFVANELERKGYAPLVEAIRGIDAPVQLLVVGRVDARAARGAAEQHGLSDRVTFTGATPDVADFYAAADVFALPTKYEAWGLVIIEAMASGLPVLTSRLAGASVAVRNGDTGILLDDPGDPLEIAEGLRRLIGGGHNDRATISTSVASYEWATILGDYEAVLRSAAEVGGR